MGNHNVNKKKSGVRVASNFHDQRLKVAVPAIGLRGLSLNASLIGNGEGAMRFSYLPFAFLLLLSSSHSSLHCTSILVVQLLSERHVFRFTLFLRSLLSALFDFIFAAIFNSPRFRRITASRYCVSGT